MRVVASLALPPPSQKTTYTLSIASCSIGQRPRPKRFIALLTTTCLRSAPQQLTLLFELVLADLALCQSFLKDVQRPTPMPTVTNRARAVAMPMVTGSEATNQQHNQGHEADEAD